jgi:hypothetical protein
MSGFLTWKKKRKRKKYEHKFGASPPKFNLMSHSQDYYFHCHDIVICFIAWTWYTYNQVAFMWHTMWQAWHFGLVHSIAESDSHERGPVLCHPNDTAQILSKNQKPDCQLRRDQSASGSIKDGGCRILAFLQSSSLEDYFELLKGEFFLSIMVFYVRFYLI